MDCEKFDQILIDALYDELDELTLAAAKRHADGCRRCQTAWSGLRATLKVGVLPTVEPPASLEPNILEAARKAHGRVPFPKRVGRAISWAGSYAMRPQTAMAAILVLMLGSSVIFVRRKPDRSGPSRVSVTERGVPEQAVEAVPAERIGMPRTKSSAQRSARRDEDQPKSGGPVFAPAPAAPPAPREAPGNEEGRVAKGAAEKSSEPFAEAPMPARGRVAQADDTGATDGIGALADRSAESKRKDETGAGNAPGAPPPAAAPKEQKDPYAAATELYTAGRYAEAEHAFSEVAASGGKNAANAAHYSAKSTEAAYGCGRAAAKYEMVASRFAGTSAAALAQWDAANCHKLNGDLDRAYALYKDLRSVAGYRDRAEAQLENLKILQQQRATRAAPAKPAAPPPQATAAPKNATQPAQ
jgi:hypothetical protein